MSQQALKFYEPVDDAKRQTELYQGIWAVDSSYGTKLADVMDTVEHRIAPHMIRLSMEGHRAESVIDFGAGDGRFLQALCQRFRISDYKCRGVDVYRPPTYFGEASWYQQPMWEPIAERFDYAISTDALEHLPPSKVPATLENIARCAPHGFLRISLIEDRYGTERGLHLHESVFPSIVWRYHCEKAGIKITSYKVYLDDNGERALEVWF